MIFKTTCTGIHRLKYKGDFMRKILCAVFILICITLTSCSQNRDIGIIGGADGPTKIMVSKKGEKNMFEEITAQKAKEIMDNTKNVIILDVREEEEFNEGHIPGAILIPYTQIEDKAEEILQDKNALILVYCRSGRRSKIAAQSLCELGYTNIKEFGGIIDWPYEIEK